VHLTLESAFSTGALVGHAGYVLLILSMLMTRMTWLRILAIGAGLLQAAYYILWLHDPVGTFWESLFVLTNAGQLGIAAYRNSMARFSPDERAFYEIAVPTLEPAAARRLLKLGRWVDAPAGTMLATAGEPVPDLAFIVSGDIEIKVGSQVVGHCGPGSFVGEISVSSGGPATASAVAVSPVRYLAFEREFLRRLLDKSDEIGRAVEQAFRAGLREKLVRANETMAAAPRTP
jgi:hypothetical protein